MGRTIRAILIGVAIVLAARLIAVAITTRHFPTTAQCANDVPTTMRVRHLLFEDVWEYSCVRSEDEEPAEQIS